MKIAIVTITYNDGYKIKEWHNHYLEYKNEIFLHIIVDNNSNKEYLEVLKKTFVDSYIIERSSNGGCTGAYNDGIKYALSIPDITAIMLLANDIRLEIGAIRILHNALFSNSKLGMVSPILLNKDSTIVADFGCGISNMLIMQPYSTGKQLKDINKDIQYCDSLIGGVNISKRIFYEMVGLQDENLFMYSDEVDIGIRAKKHGFTLAAVRDSVAWHQHINRDTTLDRRDAFTKYLGGRNKVYLAKKHFSSTKALFVFLFIVSAGLYKIMNNAIKGRFSYIREYRWMILGAAMGLIGNMEHNKFSLPEQDTSTKKINN